MSLQVRHGFIPKDRGRSHYEHALVNMHTLIVPISMLARVHLARVRFAVGVGLRNDE